MSVFIAGIAVILTWLAVLTVLVFRTVSHYNRLTRGITKTGLSDVLDAILRTLSSVRTKAEQNEKAVRILGSESEHHIQRIGIVRFNPFADTGGAQSFVIALLNDKGSGVVMTSLYGRNGNRWYLKEVQEGRGKDVALSKEEEGAIKSASLIGKTL